MCRAWGKSALSIAGFYRNDPVLSILFMRSISDDNLELQKQGEFLRELRLNAGLTQEKIAEILGCSTRQVRNIELGRSDPRFSLARKWIYVTMKCCLLRLFSRCVLFPVKMCREKK